MDDPLARFLRVAGIALVLWACVVSMLGRGGESLNASSWAILLYPLVMAALLVAYGCLTRQRFSFAAAGLVLAVWLTGAGWRGYCWLRQVVMGLDHILLSLALFALALLISLGKSGILSRWIATRRRIMLASTELQKAGGAPPTPGDS